MKKNYFILLMTVCILFLAACNNNDKKNEDNDAIGVEKNITNVEITIPASLVDEQTLSELNEEAKEKGIKEVIKNDDGSITYKMSKSAHKKLMKEMKEDIIESIDELVTDDDFVSIKDVKYNKSFEKFTVVVDKEKYENSFDGFATLAIGMSGMYYQLFNGVDSEKIKVTISLEDEATNKVFNTIIYPDAFEQE